MGRFVNSQGWGGESYEVFRTTNTELLNEMYKRLEEVSAKYGKRGYEFYKSTETVVDEMTEEEKLNLISKYTMTTEG
ncbi:MAG: hypothetical protein ACRDD8_15830 [Bacteroidales bacterium]